MTKNKSINWTWLWNIINLLIQFILFSMDRQSETWEYQRYACPRKCIACQLLLNQRKWVAAVNQQHTHTQQKQRRIPLFWDWNCLSLWFLTFPLILQSRLRQKRTIRNGKPRKNLWLILKAEAVSYALEIWTSRNKIKLLSEKKKKKEETFLGWCANRTVVKKVKRIVLLNFCYWALLTELYS